MSSPSAPELLAESRSNRSVRLEGEELHPLMSTYLTTDFYSERPVVETIEVNGLHAVATCRIDNPYVSPFTGRFHLSAENGLILLQQAAILHAHLLSGLRVKVGESIVADLDIAFQRMIGDSKDIRIELHQYAYSVDEPTGRRRHPRVSRFWTFAFAGTAWTGRMRGVGTFR